MPRIRAALGALAFAAVAPVLAQPAPSTAPLSVAQVESVTGLKGLTLANSKVDRTARTFTTSDNELALTMKIAHASVFDFWRDQASADDQAPLPGLADEAFASKKGRYVCLRKASKGMCLVAKAATGNAAQLISEAQLMELARTAAGNL